jgi:hypothetical protein
MISARVKTSLRRFSLSDDVKMREKTSCSPPFFEGYSGGFGEVVSQGIWYGVKEGCLREMMQWKLAGNDQVKEGELKGK